MKDIKGRIAGAKVIIKRHGGFNLVGQYHKTDEQIEQYLKDLIDYEETMLQSIKEMLAERDFH